MRVHAFDDSFGFEKMERGSLKMHFPDRVNPKDKHIGLGVPPWCRRTGVPSEMPPPGGTVPDVAGAR
jgi:hypothetical protein